MNQWQFNGMAPWYFPLGAGVLYLKVTERRGTLFDKSAWERIIGDGVSVTQSANCQANGGQLLLDICYADGSCVTDPYQLPRPPGLSVEEISIPWRERRHS